MQVQHSCAVPPGICSRVFKIAGKRLVLNRAIGNRNHGVATVPEQDLNDAQAQLEVAQAEVRIQQKRLNETRLIAPFEGIMARKLVEDFANVQEKQPVLRGQFPPRDQGRHPRAGGPP